MHHAQHLRAAGAQEPQTIAIARMRNATLSTVV